MKSKQFILLGPPGVDVETQAIALSKRWHVPYVSMGELCREEIAKASALGGEVRPYVEARELVPDALVMRLMRRRLEQPDMLDGWVLTGFPRTLAQAQAFDELLLTFERPAAQLAYIKVMTGLLINRLLAEKASNKSITALRQQLARHQADMAPLMAYYQQRSRLTNINGSLSTAEVINALFYLGYEETGAARFIDGEAELDSLLAEKSLVVVDCVASWCGPCKQVTPLIERLADEYGDRASVVKLDFDNNRQVAKRFELKGMPSVMFFKDGERLETLTGVKPYKAYSDVIASFL